MSDLEWNNLRDVSCLADAAGRGIKWRARDFGPGSPIHPIPSFQWLWVAFQASGGAHIVRIWHFPRTISTTELTPVLRRPTVGDPGSIGS